MISAMIQKTRMLIYCTRNGDTAIEGNVEDLGAGAGHIKCYECGGDGNGEKFALGMAPPDTKCPDDKGAG
jgi:hypothetical protein